MYIDPFAAGVIITIIVELILLYAYAIYANWKKR